MGFPLFCCLRSDQLYTPWRQACRRQSIMSTEQSLDHSTPRAKSIPLSPGLRPVNPANQSHGHLFLPLLPLGKAALTQLSSQRRCLHHFPMSKIAHVQLMTKSLHRKMKSGMSNLAVCKQNHLRLNCSFGGDLICVCEDMSSMQTRGRATSFCGRLGAHTCLGARYVAPTPPFLVANNVRQYTPEKPAARCKFAPAACCSIICHDPLPNLSQGS